MPCRSEIAVHYCSVSKIGLELESTVGRASMAYGLADMAADRFDAGVRLGTALQ
jgi:hypothetical protein